MMKKRIIILLIVTISLSLIGLISIQLYWIKNAISVKEVNFDRGVSEAVSSAIYKYNKIELANKFFNKRVQNQQFDQFYNILDSLNRLQYQKLFSGENAAENNIHNEDEAYQSQWSENRGGFFISRTITENVEHHSDTSFYAGSMAGPPTGEGYAKRSTTSNIEESSFRVFRERTKIINDFFDDLFHNRASINLPNDVRQSVLDSLINRELQNNGINTEYDFGIYNPVLNTISAEKNGKHSEKILKEGYVFSLYPNDIFTHPESLLIYFPNKTRYVLSTLNVMLGISTIFIFIIIFSFVFIIFTLIRHKKLSVMKNDFINNMTHELKTPISTISLACQALHDKDVQKTDKLFNSYVNMINEENKRLGTMTEKVLQTALIDKGKLKLNFTGIDMHEIVENAIEKISLQLKNRQGEIKKQLNAECTYLEGDKVHIANVIFNLLDNAIKYTKNNPYIIVTTDNTEQGVLISIKDNGVGIGKAHQKKIFENLYRISTGNIHDVKGFGLGLSYAKNVVELHNGYIDLESEINKGSTFTIFLPFGFNKHSNN